ncbi:MAG TPA: YciI family protein [Candidatus Competibacter sp.]|nr:dehydrogenase [Candidatus Competibacteraceae bacterium]HRE55200.1 YciI family protein [Candidatus Competibacter sp.]
MSYLLLIVEPVGQRQARSEKEARHLYQQMLDFEEDLKKRGLFLASSSLRPVAEGVRVRVREGKRAVIDGPFSEAKEMVGGFFLLDCDSREQAIAIAGECPAAEWATVEVRETGPCYLA